MGIYSIKNWEALIWVSKLKVSLQILARQTYIDIQISSKKIPYKKIAEPIEVQNMYIGTYFVQ